MRLIRQKNLQQTKRLPDVNSERLDFLFTVLFLH